MSDKRPVAPEGFDQTGRELAVVEERADSGRGTSVFLVLGMLWCLIGSSSAALVPVLSGTIVAFGMVMATRGAGRRGEVIAIVGSLIASCAGTYLLLGPFDILSAVLTVICAYAVARGVLAGRLRTSGLLLAGTAMTIVMIGIDTVSTSLQGTSIPQVVTGALDAVVESAGSGSLDLDGTSALLDAKEQMLAYWPTVYFVTAMGTVACSLFGALAGMRTTGAPVAGGLIARYDVPLWVAELFALGVAADLVGPHLPRWADEVTMVGANLVMCARLALAQQGLSVLLWRMQGRQSGFIVRVVSILTMIWLEMSFALASIVGLVDVAYNFRRFDRGRPSLRDLTTREQ